MREDSIWRVEKFCCKVEFCILCAEALLIGAIRWVSDAYVLLANKEHSMIKKRNVVCHECFHRLENINSVILASNKELPIVTRKERSDQENAAASIGTSEDEGMYLSGESVLVPTEVVE
jgi:hypothetical protein